jgi:hypothetical protein
VVVERHTLSNFVALAPPLYKIYKSKQSAVSTSAVMIKSPFLYAMRHSWFAVP